MRVSDVRRDLRSAYSLPRSDLGAEPGRPLVFIAGVHPTPAAVHLAYPERASRPAAPRRQSAPSGSRAPARRLLPQRSHWIIRYLAEIAGNPARWLGDTPCERARINQLLSWYHTNLRLRGTLEYFLPVLLAPRYLGQSAPQH